MQEALDTYVYPFSCHGTLYPDINQSETGDVTVVCSRFVIPACILAVSQVYFYIYGKISAAQTGNFKDNRKWCSLLFIHWLFMLSNKVIYRTKWIYWRHTPKGQNPSMFCLFLSFFACIHLPLPPSIRHCLPISVRLPVIVLV